MCTVCHPPAVIITQLPRGDEGAPGVWPCCPPSHSFEVFLCSPHPLCSHPQDLEEQLPPRTGLWIFAQFPLSPPDMENLKGHNKKINKNLRLFLNHVYKFPEVWLMVPHKTGVWYILGACIAWRINKDNTNNSYWNFYKDYKTWSNSQWFFDPSVIKMDF